MISTSAAASPSNLSSSERKPRCRMRGCFGIWRMLRADQHQVEPVRVHHGVALEELEHLAAPLVGVDPADVDGERPPHVELLAESPRLGALGNLRSDADDDAGTLALAHVLDQRALLERVVHDGADAAEHRLKDRQADRRIALGRRHEDRLVRHRAGAVPRVVVAVAEEDEEIELVADAADVARRARGSSVPRCRATSARRRSNAAVRRRRPSAVRNRPYCAAARPGTGAR